MISLRLEDMPDEKEDLESLLDRAKAQEKEYDWIGATATYNKLIKAIPTSEPDRLCELSERIAYSLHRYAFQCSTNGEFIQRINDAIAAYSKAKEGYGKLPEAKANPYLLRCDAMIALEEYWRAASVAEKKRRITVSWDFASKSMKEFSRQNKFRELADTHLQLGFSGYMTHVYSWDYSQRKAIVKESMDVVEEVTNHLANGKDSDLVARLLVNLSVISNFWGTSYASRQESAKYTKRSANLLNKAVRLSEESAACQMALPDAWGRLPLDSVTEVGFLEKALVVFRRSGDVFLIGSALTELAVQTWWILGESGTADDQRVIVDRSIELALEAKDVYSIISHKTPNWNGYLWIETPDAALHARLSAWEKDVNKIRESGLKGLEYTPRMIELAKECEYPDIISLAYWLDGICRFGAAAGETNDDRKREMLQCAIESFNEAIRIEETVDPGMLWDRGVSLCQTASVSYELSLLTSDIDRRKKEMSAAADRLRKGIDLEEESLTMVYLDLERSIDLVVGTHCSNLGDWYLELHGLDAQESSLLQSRDAYSRAHRHHEHGGLFSRAAEDQWNAAKVSDSLGDHSTASNLFKRASESYLKAIGKVPRLRQMYEDHAMYMSAWSEIELARQAHSRQEYGKAKDHYEKAAELHESTTKWKHLACNYRAWAGIENGEDLSRKEKSEAAIDSFHNAEDLFAKTRSSLEDYKKQIENQDERLNVDRLIRASDLRKEYCNGRVALEEAKILDRQGEEFASCERFGCAEATFRRIRSDLESNQDKREIGLIMTLAKAWQTMAKAESEASPDLYEEASNLFEESRDLSVGETAKLLALGHSKFCKALAAGTEFAESGDPALHVQATQSLESAAKSYLKAGLEKDAEYANASKLLFDAYVFMDKAGKEEDATKKTRLYAMTEKVLEASASAYVKAGYPKKKEQVSRLQQKVTQDRALAVSLMEILHAPDAVSSTMTFPVPAATQEKANGVDGFRHASIQATLIVKPREMNVGEEMRIDLEIVNAGGAPAQIIKIEKAVPRGFELLGGPESYRVEDDYLNMRGKRLDSLRAEDITLRLKSASHGHFLLTPRIMYLDESGKYKTFEPDPIEVTVKELGVAGWLRGPDKRK